MPLIHFVVVLIVVGVLSLARQSFYTDGRIK
jgi:Tfp pilus assembly protein PilE